MATPTHKKWTGYLAALAGVIFITILYRLFITNVNATTIALSYLLVVLGVASVRGLGPGVLASLLGMFLFNYFFLPPVGTLTIHDPQNWVALIVFLIIAMIASHLSSAARTKADDAENRREELWKLYQLSRTIIATTDSETAFSSVADVVLRVFGFSYCAVYVQDAEGTLSRLAVAPDDQSSTSPQSEQREAEQVMRTGTLSFFYLGTPYGRKRKTDASTEEVKAYTPLKVGTKCIGVAVLTSASLERSSVEAIAGLVALALERARFLEEVSYTQALRQSDKLKSALLDSVSHDLRTPLTSIRAAVDNLLHPKMGWDESTLQEFLQIISEETARLNRLVQNILEMARIEAGEVSPSKRWHSVSEIIDNVLEHCAMVGSGREIVIDADERLPQFNVDSRLLSVVLTHLVENAVKYSPPRSAIIIRTGVVEEGLSISVINEGPGIGTDDIKRVFDRFYRATRKPEQRGDGTGMGLAIARGIVEAHGGKIWADSVPGRGATFTFTVPAELKDMAEPVPMDGRI